MSNKVTVKLASDKKNVKLRSRASNSLIEQETDEQILRKQLNDYYDKGFNEGQQIIKKELEGVYTEKLLEKFNELHLMFADFDEKVLEYEKAFEEIVIELSVNVAEKIIKREVEKKSTIKENLKESLKKVLGANEVFVRLNPEDFNELHNDDADILKEGTYSKLKFEADDRIDKGGCFVETEIGNVDSRISTQLNEIAKHLKATYMDEIE